MYVCSHLRFPWASVGLFLAWISAATVLAWSPPQGHADTRERYVFLLSQVDLPANAPPSLEDELRTHFAEAVQREALLDLSLPKDAPPYRKTAKGRFGNKPFHNYLTRKHLKAFRITLEVTNYASSSEANPRKPGHLLNASLVLNMFGETIPDRVMAFRSDGSAKVMAEVGKTIRARDRRWVHSDVASLALEKAMHLSLAKLRSRAPGSNSVTSKKTKTQKNIKKPKAGKKKAKKPKAGKKKAKKPKAGKKSHRS